MKYSFEDIDERIIKTRLALSGAIFEMIKKCNNVKVLDICKRADVTPMTYYHHFHNKTQLLDFAVKSQLQNILPIPQKLKPINMKQLVAYLLKSFINFFNQNNEIIKSSVNKILLKGYKNSFIYVLLNNMWYFIYQEIRKLIKTSDQMFVSIWTSLITYGLFFMLIKINLTPKQYEFPFLWNSLKQLWINL